MYIKHLIVLFALFIHVLPGFAQEAEFDWVTTTNVDGTEHTQVATTDSKGNVYSCGGYTDAGDFNNGPGVDSLEHIGASSFTKNLYIKKTIKMEITFGRNV